MYNLEMQLWQLYRTNDDDKIGKLFESLAYVVPTEDLDRCLAYAWGDTDVFD